jgi:lipid A 3-O-deacylase
VKKILAGLLAGSSLFAAPKSDQVSFSSGMFDCMRVRHRTYEFGIEYKFYPAWSSPFHFLDFRPLLGIMANARKSTYLYGGINFDLFPSEHFVIAPGFAAGWYSQGHGKNLGYPLEFRTLLQVAWQFNGENRLGAEFYHISNAGLGRHNPGEESIVLFYDVPVKSGFPFKTN